MWKPPKGTIFAPCARCRSYRGVFWRGALLSRGLEEDAWRAVVSGSAGVLCCIECLVVR